MDFFYNSGLFYKADPLFIIEAFVDATLVFEAEAKCSSAFESVSDDLSSCKD